MEIPEEITRIIAQEIASGQEALNASKI